MQPRDRARYSAIVDRPPLQLSGGPRVTLPYTVELDDIPMMMVQHQPPYWLTRIRYLEELYAPIAQHEGVLHWNGAEILEWRRSQ